MTFSLRMESNIFALASHADPGPLVLAEAREAGCAIIATSVDGIPEMLDGGKAGILVPPKRPDLFANAIVKVLTDAALLANLRARSRSNVGYFSVNRVANDYLAIYKSLFA